jgi:hypothetical protein
MGADKDVLRGVTVIERALGEHEAVDVFGLQRRGTFERDERTT